MQRFKTFAQIEEYANANNMKISEVTTKFSAQEMEVSEKTFRTLMKNNLNAMRCSIEKGLSNRQKSSSGLVGNYTNLMQQFNQNNVLFGDLFNDVILYALSVSELNSCMGCIVAAPTAGSCGIIPALLFPLQKRFNFSDEQLLDALICSSAIGYIIAKNAYIAGASGGCQAECGSASAMGAGAICELLGGTPTQVSSAAAHALKSLLGLVCDPVAGMVEEPCIVRNVSSAVISLSSAQLGLSNINSIINLDETIMAMKEISDDMDPKYKETAQGGLAATPTGKKIQQEIFGI